MKKLLLIVLLLSAPARAELWQGANVHSSGLGGVGAYGQIYVPSSTFLAVGQLTYGFGHHLQGEFRLGFGTGAVYVGGFVKYQLVENSAISFSLWGGAHSFGSTGIDLAGIFSHSFGTWELYGAPMITLDGVGRFALVPGFNIAVSSTMKVYGEVGIGMTNYGNTLGGGVRFFF